MQQARHADSQLASVVAVASSPWVGSVVRAALVVAGPLPAAYGQHVVQSLEKRLAILCGGLERCSFEGALASMAISSAPVAGSLDTVVGVCGG